VAGNVTVALPLGDAVPDGGTTDVMALFVVYVAVTAVPRGPKLDPKIVTTWLPAVKASDAPAPSKAVITGDPYDVGPTVPDAACRATAAVQYRPAPMPGAVTHCSWDDDSVPDDTEQFTAVYALGAHTGPYTTLISASFTTDAVADAGPKSDPSINTIWPPSVFAYRLPAPEIPVRCGARNDVVATDAPLGWPPTTTLQLWFAPTPNTPKQLTHAWPTGSRLQFVAVRTRPSLGDTNVTSSGDPAGPKLLPTSVTLDGTPGAVNPSVGSKPPLLTTPVIAGGAYDREADPLPPITADTPFMLNDSTPATPLPGAVLATIVVALQLVRFKAYTPTLPTVPLQLAPSLVPTITNVSPPTVANVVRVAVTTLTLDTNGGVVSAMAGNEYTTAPLLCPARLTDTLYVTPRDTVVLHLAVVCRAKHGTHDPLNDSLAIVTFNSARESPKFWPWNWKMASLAMLVMAWKHASVA